MKHELRPAQAKDLPAIIALLSEGSLPSSDLSVNELRYFHVAESAGQLAGVGGVERYGAAGLLRSVAVAAVWRGRNLGANLVRQCEATALLAGVETIYLLTTTADGFFRHLGYVDMQRETMPPAIAAHVQFRSLCPSSAKCMGKHLKVDIKLYGTVCCHLCEEAEAILNEVGVKARHIDIAEDDELLAQYGTRIPVLKRLDTGAELGWPFDAEAVARFMEA